MIKASDFNTFSSWSPTEPFEKIHLYRVAPIAKQTMPCMKDLSDEILNVINKDLESCFPEHCNYRETANLAYNFEKARYIETITLPSSTMRTIL